MISKLKIPYRNIIDVYTYIRQQGISRLEGVALFVGYSTEDTFFVTEAIIPEQKCYNHDNQLFYIVESDELLRINTLLYDKGLTTIAQIHSHPGEAFHSDLDDERPIISKKGQFSFVVPNFGFDKITTEYWEAYQLLGYKEWKHLTKEELNELIEIIWD